MNRLKKALSMVIVIAISASSVTILSTVKAEASMFNSINKSYRGTYTCTYKVNGKKKVGTITVSKKSVKVKNVVIYGKTIKKQTFKLDHVNVPTNWDHPYATSDNTRISYVFKGKVNGINVRFETNCQSHKHSKWFVPSKKKSPYDCNVTYKLK